MDGCCYVDIATLYKADGCPGMFGGFVMNPPETFLERRSWFSESMSHVVLAIAQGRRFRREKTVLLVCPCVDANLGVLR